MKFVVTGQRELNAKLKEFARKQQVANKEDVLVGFSQSYAIYVHEVPARHPVGEDKFLEKSLRKNAANILSIVARVYEKTKSLTQGLVIAGLKIQGDAQKITPVDTGALKASAWTAKESNAAAEHSKTLAEAEAIRKAELARRRNK